MSKPTTCTCATPSDYTWHKAPANEDGWHCLDCGSLAAGEPPGYRPDLDASHLGCKVESILMDLHDEDLVYVSNSTDGECLVGMVAKDCGRSGHRDQYSIVASILGHMNRTHADYWKERGDAIRAGEDKRERCECGKLASSYGGGHPPRCSDCAWDKGLGLLAAEPRKPGEPDTLDPWEAYGLWEAKWLEDHPDDERDSLGLIEEYAKVPTGELMAFFNGIERDRMKGGRS